MNEIQVLENIFIKDNDIKDPELILLMLNKIFLDKYNGFPIDFSKYAILVKLKEYTTLNKNIERITGVEIPKEYLDFVEYVNDIELEFQYIDKIDIKDYFRIVNIDEHSKYDFILYHKVSDSYFGLVVDRDSFNSPKPYQWYITTPKTVEKVIFE